MIASETLLIITFISLFTFAISTLLLYIKFPKSRAIKLFILYFLFIFLGLLLTSFRNKIPNFISLQLGLTSLAVAYMFLYIGLKEMLGLESKWHKRYYIPIVVLFIGTFLFTFIYYDLHMRIVIFSLYIAIYTFATALLFYNTTTKDYKKLHQLIAIIYIMASFIFIIRAINSTIFGYHLQVFYSTQFIVNSPYISLIIVSFLLIIVTNIYLRSSK